MEIKVSPQYDAREVFRKFLITLTRTNGRWSECELLENRLKYTIPLS